LISCTENTGENKKGAPKELSYLILDFTPEMCSQSIAQCELTLDNGKGKKYKIQIKNINTIIQRVSLDSIPYDSYKLNFINSFREEKSIPLILNKDTLYFEFDLNESERIAETSILDNLEQNDTIHVFVYSVSCMTGVSNKKYYSFYYNEEKRLEIVEAQKIGILNVTKFKQFEFRVNAVSGLYNSTSYEAFHFVLGNDTLKLQNRSCWKGIDFLEHSINWSE